MPLPYKTGLYFNKDIIHRSALQAARRRSFNGLEKVIKTTVKKGVHNKIKAPLSVGGIVGFSQFRRWFIHSEWGTSLFLYSTNCKPVKRYLCMVSFFVANRKDALSLPR